MPSFTISLDREILELAMEKDETIEIHLSVKPPSDTRSAHRISVPPRGPLAGLMTSGRLTAGDRLIFSQPRANRAAIATVRADGSLEVQGKTGVFWSPSKAAAAITGSQINGWTVWRKYDDGRTLDELRTEDEEGEG
jgi:site-specific DNA-methyltransferase (adenine-specific)